MPMTPEPRDRHTWPLLAVAMAIVGAAALAGCASPNAVRSPASKAATVAPKQEPGTASVDLLLAEALRQLFNHRDPAQALAMVQLAVKRAPDRIDAAWLQLRICIAAPACQPEPFEARLRKLDPTNGVVWLGALDRASQRNDRATADQILDAIARSERVDVYWNGLVTRIADALAERARNNARANPAPNATSDAIAARTPVTDALNEAVSLLSQAAVPAFEPLAENCSVRRLTDRLVAARCLLIAATLQRSDTYMGESMGLGIAQRLAAGDNAETGKVEQRIAVSRYQRDTAGEIINAQIERDRFATQQLDLMRKQRREQDVFVAIIRWAGKPLTPPR